MTKAKHSIPYIPSTLEILCDLHAAKLLGEKLLGAHLDTLEAAGPSMKRKDFEVAYAVEDIWGRMVDDRRDLEDEIMLMVATNPRERHAQSEIIRLRKFSTDGDADA